MKKIFINHTNHPSARWSAEQLAASRAYGQIADVPFPAVDAEATAEEVRELVRAQADRIMAMEPAAVLCQGEFNYTFALVEQLKNLVCRQGDKSKHNNLNKFILSGSLVNLSIYNSVVSNNLFTFVFISGFIILGL